MEKMPADRLPSNLYQFFRCKSMHGIVSTVDEDGYPRGAPMSMFFALNDRVMLMAAQNASQTYANATRTGKLALTFVGKGDLAFTIKGDARVFKARMQNSDRLGILAVRVKAVKSNVACDVEVSEGIRTEFRSERWKNWLLKMMNELRSYTLQDIEEIKPGWLDA